MQALPTRANIPKSPVPRHDPGRMPELPEPEARARCGRPPSRLGLSEPEQGTGEAGVGDQAVDHATADRRADRNALGDAVGDGDHGRDPRKRRSWRHDHAAVQRGLHGTAVLPEEYPGHLRAHAELSDGVPLAWAAGVIDRRQAGRPSLASRTAREPGHRRYRPADGWR